MHNLICKVALQKINLNLSSSVFNANLAQVVFPDPDGPEMHTILFYKNIKITYYS